MASNIILGRTADGTNKVFLSDSEGNMGSRPYMKTTTHTITTDSFGNNMNNQLSKGSSTATIDTGDDGHPKNIGFFIYADGITNEPNADDKWGLQVSIDNTNWIDVPTSEGGVVNTHSNDTTNSKRSVYGRVENVLPRYVRLQSARDSAGSCLFGSIKLIVEERF